MARLRFHPTAWRHAALLIGMAVVLVSCAGQQVVGTPSDQARVQYQKGQDLFQDENYLEAINAFNIVRTRFPYSSYATLAELKIADSHYELGKYVEAAAAYRSFIRFHPHHERRAYAMYRVGECYFEQIPGDWWFMPPAHERELGSTTDALRELQAFVREYPQEQLVAEAEKKIGRLRKRLAQHELYVARFYWKARKPRGAVMRLDFLLDRYGDAGLSGEALLLKAEAHAALDEPGAAQESLARLLREYPQSSEAPKAKKQLAVLQQQRLTAPAPPVPQPLQPAQPPGAPASSPATAPQPQEQPEQPLAGPES